VDDLSGALAKRVIPTLCVGDVSAALEWYTQVLGFEEGWHWGDPPTHASVRSGGAEIHLSGLDPDPGGSWLYIVVSDVDAMHVRLSERGANVEDEPRDQEYGMRDFPVRDLVGNHLTLASPVGDEPE
jgi:uncharacterized glyoxalase superfamily protein PhnB